jgi:hypothetical protein
MKTLLSATLLCALLASVAGWAGGIAPAGAQNAAYTDTMDSEADGLLSTVSPDPAIVSFAYQDGTFVIQAPNQAAPKELLTDIKTPSMEGTQVLFDVAISGDVNLKYVVVGCRAGPGHSGYQLAVDLDTAEATLRSRDGQYSQVLDRTEAPVPLNTGATMNQIGIECEDTRINAIVNGVTVLTAFDTEYTDGYSYLGVGSRVGASGGLIATFDNLTVADLGASGFESPGEDGHVLAPSDAPGGAVDPLTDPEAALVQVEIMSVLAAPTAGPLGGDFDVPSRQGVRLPLGVQLQDFYAQLTYITPQQSPAGLWLYGFCFWADPSGSCTDFFIQSDGTSARWGVGSFPSTGGYTLLDSGDMPAGSVDLTPGAENVLDLLVYNGSAILGANGQVAATFRLSSQPIAGDIAGRAEFSGNDPSDASPLAMSAYDLAVWDLSGYPLMVYVETPADGSLESGGAEDASSIVERTCRLTGPDTLAPGHCNEEATS